MPSWMPKISSIERWTSCVSSSDIGLGKRLASHCSGTTVFPANRFAMACRVAGSSISKICWMSESLSFGTSIVYAHWWCFGNLGRIPIFYYRYIYTSTLNQRQKSTVHCSKATVLPKSLQVDVFIYKNIGVRYCKCRCLCYLTNVLTNIPF